MFIYYLTSLIFSPQMNNHSSFYIQLKALNHRKFRFNLQSTHIHQSKTIQDNQTMRALQIVNIFFKNKINFAILADSTDGSSKIPPNVFEILGEQLINGLSTENVLNTSFLHLYFLVSILNVL